MSFIWYAIKYPVKLKFPLIEKKKNAVSYVHAFKNEATFFTAIKWNWKYILDEILFKAPPVYFFYCWTTDKILVKFHFSQLN